MAKSLCRLLMEVNHALVVNFNVTKMSFKAIRKNIWIYSNSFGLNGLSKTLHPLLSTGQIQETSEHEKLVTGT